jgi:uncharacterized surface protein with fasciclin (FAS1) repeats
MIQGRILYTLVCAIVLVPLPGHTGTWARESAGKDIIDVIEESGRFTAFLAAVRETGIEETLRGEGPFTLFAPTDEAFAKLPRAILDGLLKDRALLKRTLLFHVVAGRVSSPEFLNRRVVRNIHGHGLRAAMRGTTITVENASIVSGDLPAANGVIHVIDSVLMPTSQGAPR